MFKIFALFHDDVADRSLILFAILFAILFFFARLCGESMGDWNSHNEIGRKVTVFLPRCLCL